MRAQKSAGEGFPTRRDRRTTVPEHPTFAVWAVVPPDFGDSHGSRAPTRVQPREARRAGLTWYDETRCTLGNPVTVVAAASRWSGRRSLCSGVHMRAMMTP